MTYDLLYALSSPHLTHYRSDLEKHDRETIDANPGVPFLHWTRACGTDLTLMPEADTYPPKGERVPFLFGTADRHHVLKMVTEIAVYEASPYNSPRLMVLHYDGDTLREVSLDNAIEIANQYRARIEREWRSADRREEVLA
jgi:hypothetical protein